MKRIMLFLLGCILFSGISAQYSHNRDNGSRFNNQQRSNTNRSSNRTIKESGSSSTVIDLSSLFKSRKSKKDNNEERNANSTSNSSSMESSSVRSAKESSEKQDKANVSQSNVITLTASGEGKTKDEATKVALRSATEQAFGTFVSANTEVINDELVKDEIVTVNKGVIKSYKEISSIDLQDGNKSVTIQAVVSINGLVTYAQNKGMSTELAGATFAMNKKMRQLNKQNEEAAINHLGQQLKGIASIGLFDYTLETSDPYESNGRNIIDCKIVAKLNDNGRYFYDVLYKTLDALSLSSEEMNEYSNSGVNYYKVQFWNMQDGRSGQKIYNLRNKYLWHVGGIGNSSSLYILQLPISYMINSSLLNFSIQDNLNNDFHLVFAKDEGLISKLSGGKIIISGGKHRDRSDWFEEKYGHPDSSEMLSLFGYDVYFDQDNDKISCSFIVTPRDDHFHKFSGSIVNLIDHTYIMQIKNEFNFSFVAEYSDDEIMKLTSIKVVPNH